MSRRVSLTLTLSLLSCLNHLSSAYIDDPSSCFTNRCILDPFCPNALIITVMFVWRWNWGVAQTAVRITEFNRINVHMYVPIYTYILKKMPRTVIQYYLNNTNTHAEYRNIIKLIINIKERILSVLLYILHIPSAEQNFENSTVLPLFPKSAHKNIVY
jgi:hypothetical protein